MINEVILEGIVLREPWKFMDDLFFRLVIYRDSDLPTKKLERVMHFGLEMIDSRHGTKSISE